MASDLNMLTQAQKIAISNEVHAINERLHQVEAQISTLQEECAQLKGRKANLLSQFSPVWMPPTEILSYIFQLAHEEASKNITPEMNRYRSKLGNCNFRITISHVCQHFRNIALRTSTLWTKIHFKSLTSSKLDYINACLERSGTSLLTIIFYFSFLEPSQPCPGSAKFGEAMTLVQANISRLERLMLVNTSNEVMRVVMGYFDRPAPQLTTLTMLSSPAFRDTFFNSSIFVGNKLTKLQLRSVPVVWSQWNAPNLVEFDLIAYFLHHQISYQDFWTIIENSPSLRKLRLEECSILQPDGGLGTQKLHMLNSLQILDLSYVSLNSCLALMSRLHAPNLKYLFLEDMVEDDYSSLLNWIAQPPKPFTNLLLMNFQPILVNDETAITRLRDAYSRFQGWYLNREYETPNLFGLRATLVAEGLFECLIEGEE